MKHQLFTIKGSLLASFSIFLINKIWKSWIGRFYKSRNNIICRFYPSCSNYAIIALTKYGFYKGVRLSINRIKRCNTHNTDTCVDFP